MQVVVNLVGVVLATAFLLFLAITLHSVPLYFVCGIGIVLMVVAFWRDEFGPALARRGNGG